MEALWYHIVSYIMVNSDSGNGLAPVCHLSVNSLASGDVNKVYWDLYHVPWIVVLVMACSQYWHQAIIWTNIDLSSVRFCGIHLKTISQEMLKKSVDTWMCLKFVILNSQPHLPGVNELTSWLSMQPGVTVLIARGPRTRVTKALWAHNPNLVKKKKKKLVLHAKWWSKQATILHMPRQLSCRDMCKIVTSLDH